MPDVLQLALKARLPLVAVRTDDPLNVGKVLAVIAGENVSPFYTQPPLQLNQLRPSLPRYAIVPDKVHFHVGDCPTSYEKLFDELAEAESTLVVVNPETVHPAMFDAGTVLLPDSMITDFVEEYADGDSEEAQYSLTAALRGLSVKEMVEVAKLAMADSNEFTADAVLRVRRQRTVLSSGLQLVDTEQTFYAPDEYLTAWLKREGRLFTANVPKIVRPRGLLFTGHPGTGKTSGAKYLAHQLGVPLYALDVGSTMQKYVGESERTFSNALAQIERLAPCVLLLDEIEKAFSHDDDSGVSRRVLGMLLWWLQEHQAQVFTVMTTNDADALPEELVRPGRIDAKVEFAGLAHDEALDFARALVTNLTNVVNLPIMKIENVINRQYKETALRRPQAEVTQWVVALAQTALVKQLEN